MTSPAPLNAALHKVAVSLRQLWPAMLGLEITMAIMVACYYFWPPATLIIHGYAAWLHSGGIFATALAAALAGGMLSEISLVYIQNGGRWTPVHLERMAFNSVMFFITGCVVYEFYLLQAWLFGDGARWQVIVPKLLVDQFGFTIVWATPYQALMTRWQALRYSGARLWSEVGWNFVLERMVPILVTNWVFWFPFMALAYSMPVMLQPAMFIFGIASWGLLMPAVARQERPGHEPAINAPILSGTEVLPETSE